MSFAQLHAAAATAAADSAYLQDVREAQQALQQLRRRASAVRDLQRVYGGRSCHRQQALHEDQQVLQHQRLLEGELEAARFAADSLRKALLQLQQHIGAAASASEKHERQMYYSQLINTAGYLLHQLQDAAEGERWNLQQQHELFSFERSEQPVFGQQAVCGLEEAGRALRPGQPRSLEQAPQLTCDSTGVAGDAGSTGGASAADCTNAKGGRWSGCGAEFPPNVPLASAPAASSKAELAPPRDFPVLPSPNTGMFQGPLQWQHQLMEAKKSVPIFIPDSKIDASLLKEKRDSLAKIHREIKSIQSLYEQMAFFTQEQGARLDVVDEHLIGARQDAARAAREVAKAVRDERRRKCRRCLFVFSMSLILLFLGFAFWWNAIP